MNVHRAKSSFPFIFIAAILLLSCSNSYAGLSFIDQIPNKSIIVDGDPSDWSGVSPWITDADSDSLCGKGTDLKEFYLAKDESFIYLRVDTWSGELTIGAPDANAKGLSINFFDESETGNTVLAWSMQESFTNGNIYVRTNADPYQGETLLNGSNYGTAGKVAEGKIPISLFNDYETIGVWGYYTSPEENECDRFDTYHYPSNTSYSGDLQPGIHLDGYGVSTWTASSGYTGMDMWLKVIDYDGIAEDGSTHTVTVAYPDGVTEKTLNFQYRENPHTAFYSYWDGDVPQPIPTGTYSGDYVIRVEDMDGDWSEVVDNVQVNPIAAPDEASFYPRYHSRQSMKASFDDVYVNGVMYDAFETGYDSSKWQSKPDEVTYESGKAVFQRTWAMTESASAKMRMKDPENVNSHSATVRVINSSGSVAGARIGGTYFSDGQGDVHPWIVLRGSNVFYVVSRDYAQGSHQISDYLVPFTSMGSVTPGHSYQLSMGWDGSTVVFNVKGLDDSVDYSETFTPAGPISAPQDPQRYIEISSMLALQSTTPMFKWDEVPGARYYRVRIFNANDHTLYRGWTASPPYVLPPGILKPGGIYKYRIDSYRDHQWFETDNKAGSDRNQTWLWIDTSQDAQDPYIELEAWQGIKTWTSPRRGAHLSPWIEVYDAQGVPENIQSVKVIFPDGKTERPLYFVSRYNEYSGQYGTDYYGEMPDGEYTFVVEDRDGHIYQASEQFAANPLPPINPDTLQPAQDAVITHETVDIRWDAVNGAKMYEVRIEDPRGRVVCRERVVHPTSSITLPAALFEPGKRYSYRLRAMDRFNEEQYQNQSAPDWGIFNRTFTVAPVSAGTHPPSLDLNGWGAAQGQVSTPDGSGTTFVLEFWIQVIDPDGVPENIRSVTVQHPDLGEEVLYLFDSSSETEGYYYAERQFDNLKDFPQGDFTFQVTDHQGNTDSLIDTLIPIPVGVPKNIKPAEGATTGIQPKFTWDACENAVRYMVRLYDGWGSTLFRSPNIEETEYALPAEHQLDPERLYQYRVYAYHEEGEVDNYAINMSTFGMMPHFWTQDTLDTDQDGVNDDVDDFPYDPSASLDSDRDGYPDQWNTGYTQEDSTSEPKLVLDGFPQEPFLHVDANNDEQAGLEDAIYLLREAAMSSDPAESALKEATYGLKLLTNSAGR